MLNDIKSLLTMELKSFDTFENGKNKLLKTASQKLDGYNEKSYTDFVREFSTAINALKINVLAKLSDVKSK